MFFTRLKFQRVNEAIIYEKHEFKKFPVLHINSAAYTRIAFLNHWVFHVIFASIQLSQVF